jgi:hypothetical protein
MPNNFQVVIPNKLYRSGSISPSELPMLAGHIWKVKKIISLDEAAGTAIAPSIPNGVEHIIFPINLAGNGTSQARSLAHAIRSGLLNSKEGAVLVHCLQGRDRTGLAIALYRAIKQSWACEAIFKEAVSKGYGTGISESTKKSFDLEICRHCFGDYCKKFTIKDDEVTTGPDAQPADDIVDEMRDDISHQQGALSAGTTFPIFDQQQSFSAPVDTDMNMYPGGINIRVASKKIRKLLLKKIIKLINKDKNNIVDVGKIDIYDGIPENFVNPSASGPMVVV